MTKDDEKAFKVFCLSASAVSLMAGAYVLHDFNWHDFHLTGAGDYNDDVMSAPDLPVGETPSPVRVLQSCQRNEALDATPGYPLRDGEKNLLTRVFGDAVNTSGIRLRFCAEAAAVTRDNTAETFPDNVIRFYDQSYMSQDYSSTQNIYNFGLFMHESTHIWQYQHGMITGSNPLVYQYRLSNDYTFPNYGIEQQAAIIQDYSRRFLFAGERRSYWLPQSYGSDSAATDSLCNPLSKRLPPRATGKA